MKQHMCAFLLAVALWAMGNVVSGFMVGSALADGSSTAWSKCQAKSNDEIPDNPAQNCRATSGNCTGKCVRWVALQTTYRCQRWDWSYYCWETQMPTLADYYEADCSSRNYPRCDTCETFRIKQRRVMVPWYQCGGE